MEGNSNSLCNLIPKIKLRKITVLENENTGLFVNYFYHLLHFSFDFTMSSFCFLRNYNT